MSKQAQGSSKTRLTDRKRAAIIVAAVDQFQTHGFDGTSMDRIAETAHVSKRTVYNHFSSKDALFQAILNELSSRISEADTVIYESDQPLEDQLVELGRSFAERTTSEEVMKLSRVVISRFIQTPELAKTTLNEQAKLKQGIVDWIKAAKKDGRLSVSNPETAAQQFSGLIKAFAFWPQLIGICEPLTRREQNQTVNAAVALFLDHYGESQ